MASPQPTILLTGFPGRRMETDNFQNPTGIIVRNLHGEQVGGYTIDSVVIDCELEERHQLVRGLFEKPRVLALSLGMASIKGFQLERTARNIIDTTNNPTQLGGPRRHAIRTESLDQRLCNINDSGLLAITKSLQRADFEATVSDNAGTLGCNTMAFALYDLPAIYDLIPRLFMHVPQNPECAVQTQLDTGAPAPEMQLDRIEKGVVIVLAELALLASQVQKMR